MSLVVNTNVSSLNAQRHLAKTQKAMASSVAKLSSGLRVNSAADDAAGLGVSERLKNHVRGPAQAERNSNDGISLLQIAEGALNEIHGLLDRLRELAVQSSNGTLEATERAYIQTEKIQLAAEITRISDVTEFAGITMIGSDATAFAFQVGIRASAESRISVTLIDVDAAALAVSGTMSLSTAAAAQTAITTLDTAIDTISSRRSTIGSVLNRLAVTITNLASARENTASAFSRIRDVDVASETAELTRTQILSQAGVAMLAQANQLPSAALSLLGGG